MLYKQAAPICVVFWGIREVTSECTIAPSTVTMNVDVADTEDWARKVTVGSMRLKSLGSDDTETTVSSMQVGEVGRRRRPGDEDDVLSGRISMQMTDGDSDFGLHIPLGRFRSPLAGEIGELGEEFSLKSLSPETEDRYS